jgi:hypothetical protein
MSFINTKQSDYNLLAEAGITWKKVSESQPQSRARNCKKQKEV